MSKLQLSVAMGDYDRTRALFDGRVQIDGVDPVCMLLSPEEMFFRAMRTQDFHISELSFSSYLVKHSRGESPYIAVPVYLSRAFRHTSIYVNTKSGIDKPQDLAGKRVGLAEYQQTANVWARALLEDDYGVPPSAIRWVRGGVEKPGRKEKIALELPADVRLEEAGSATLSDMLESGELDAFIGPRSPSCFDRGSANVRRLFSDPVPLAQDWYRRTGIFPIMHVVGIRKELAAQHPWLPGAVFKAFSQAKAAAIDLLSDTSATKVTLPFVEEQLKAARDTMGEDYWSYGVAPARQTLETFVRHHHSQGLSPRQVAVEELFHPSTYESYSI